MFKSWGSNQITDVQIFSTNKVIFAKVVAKQVFFGLLELFHIGIDDVPVIQSDCGDTGALEYDLWLHNDL